MVDYKKLLNDDQYKIVTSADGPCLVLAGAGSGKTRTLTYRVAYLLENGVLPEEILLMTFTNKASKEMIARVDDVVGYKSKGMLAGTFHKIGNLLLRKYGSVVGYSPSFTILDQQDSKDLLKSCFKDLKVDVKNGNVPKVDVVHSMISFGRNTGRVLDEWLCVKYNFPSFVLDKIIALAELYEKKKKSLNAMDFDDLLVRLLDILREDSNIRERLSNRFRYILVDEYQDTNVIQASIIRLLSLTHNNVLAVGDDAQSIYSFRAADISHILNFEKDFSNAKIFKLETNYRSTPEILELANQSIAYNVNQYFKELKSVKQSGVLPNVLGAKNVYAQSDYVIERVKKRIKIGGSLNDMAVLFRAGHMSAELQLELSKNGIPFIVRSGQRYFDQAHIKDMIAILRIWANLHDELAWNRFLSLLPGIGDRSAEKIFSRIKTCAVLSEVSNKIADLCATRSVDGFNLITAIIDHLSNNCIREDSTPDIPEGIRFFYAKFYKYYLKKNYDDADSRGDDIVALLNFVANYKSLDELLADITLDDAINEKEDDGSREPLVLSTIHQAKGLEWDEVFVIGLREGSFPHYRSRESLSELEEERRLFYVAVTRARHDLHLLYPVTINSYEYGEMSGDQSLFISELDDSCYMKVGQRSNRGELLGNYGVSSVSVDKDGFLGDEKCYENQKITKKTRWKSGDSFFGDDSDSKLQESDDSGYEEPVIRYD